MTVRPRISRLAVTDPDTPLSQQDVLTLLGLEGDDFAERVFGRSAVSSRSLGLTTATLERTLQGRTARTEDQLFAEAVEAVARLEIDPAEIGTLVSAELVLARRPDARPSPGRGIRNGPGNRQVPHRRRRLREHGAARPSSRAIARQPPGQEGRDRRRRGDERALEPPHR